PLGDKSGALPARHEVCDDRGPRGVPGRCVPVNVYESILERRRAGRLHMTLLDPDKQSATEAASLAGEAGRAGTDAIMVGGSRRSRWRTWSSNRGCVPGRSAMLS